MGWFVLFYLFSTLISLVSICRLSQQEKDLEILLLRHQLAILERKFDKPVKPNRAEKLTLAVLTARLRLVTCWPPDRHDRRLREAGGAHRRRWIRSFSRPCSRFSGGGW